MNKMIFVVLVIANVVAQIVFGKEVLAALQSGVWCIGGGLIWEMVRNIK